MAEETAPTTTQPAQPAQPAANAVYHIVAFTFPGEHRAEEVMKTAKSFAADAGMKVVASAVVEVNEKGKTKVHQPGRGGVGTTVGLITGGLLGLVGGPAGLLVWAAGGALIGGIAGKHLGRALPQDALEQLGQQMVPNSSAILIIVEDKVTESAIDEMKGYNAQIVTLTVGDQLSGEIAQYVAGEALRPAMARPSQPRLRLPRLPMARPRPPNSFVSRLTVRLRGHWPGEWMRSQSALATPPWRRRVAPPVRRAGPTTCAARPRRGSC